MADVLGIQKVHRHGLYSTLQRIQSLCTLDYISQQNYISGTAP
jgi:hypothetical protein